MKGVKKHPDKRGRKEMRALEELKGSHYGQNREL